MRASTTGGEPPEKHSWLIDPVAGLYGIALCSAALAMVRSPFVDLEFFTLPKEMVLVAAALATGWRPDCIAHQQSHTALRVFLVVAVLWMLVSVAQSGAIGSGMTRATSITISAGVVFLTVHGRAHDHIARQHLSFVCLAAAVAATTAVLEAYGITERLSLPKRAPGGSFGQRNTLAHFIVLALPATYVLATRLRGHIAERGVSLVTVALIGACLVLTRTRAAWIAAALGVALLLGAATVGCHSPASQLSRRGVAGWGASMLLGIGLAVTLPNTLSWREPDPLASTARRLLTHQAGSGRGRVVQYTTTLRMIADAPLFGVGPGQWPVLYPRYAREGDPTVPTASATPIMPRPLGDWMGIAAEGGLPALGCFVAAAGALIVRHLRPLMTGNPSSAGLVAMVVMLAALGGLDAIVLRAAPAFAAAVALAALDRSDGSVGKPRVADLATFRYKRWQAVRIVFCAALLVAAPRLFASARAMLIYSQEPSIDGLLEAARLDPTDYKVRIWLAATLVAADACPEATPHIRVAADLQPYAAAPRRMRQQCESRIMALPSRRE